MARRGWDDPWQRYPESKPIKTAEGIATSKQRGAMAATWWSKRFVEVLEAYGLGSRMARGRRYARSGQVLSLQVSRGLLVGQVQGSRPTPYVLSVRAAQPPESAWERLGEVISAQVGFVARLLAGEVPTDLEEACRAAGFELFPAVWSDLDATCSCPDWENPCKHIAAALYLFADQLDDDPWLLLEWRGRHRDDLLTHLTSSGADRRADGLPSWWPLVPGRRPPGDQRWAGLSAVPPNPAHRTLLRMAPLEATFDELPMVEILAKAYEHLIEPTDPDEATGDADDPV